MEINISHTVDQKDSIWSKIYNSLGMGQPTSQLRMIYYLVCSSLQGAKQCSLPPYIVQSVGLQESIGLQEHKSTYRYAF